MAVRSDVELLTEHFGYPPVSLLDDVINSINILAERALNSVEQGLLNAPPASLGFRPPTHAPSKDNNPNGLPLAEEAHRHEIEAGTHQLETLLCASIDRNFDKFEIYVMRNILCVKPEDRDWIRLSHYEGLDFSPAAIAATTPSRNKTSNPTSTSSEEPTTKPTVESVNRLRRRLQASQKLNCMLHAEKARNAAMLEEVRKLVGSGGSNSPIIKKEDLSQSQSQSEPPEQQQQQQQQQQPQPPASTNPPLAFLHNKGALTDGGAESPITTTTAFTLSQLQALRTLSTSLRNLMPDLEVPPKSNNEQGEEDEEDTETRKSWRRERLEYVETATRKHFENVRGLELGKNGEVRDGEWQGEGRSLARGEVDGLEKVVSNFGGGGSALVGGGGNSGSGSADGGDKMDET